MAARVPAHPAAGGLVFATTRKSSFIQYCAELRARCAVLAFSAATAASTFEADDTLIGYDAGQFWGRGRVLDQLFYGETCIPRKLRREGVG